MRLTLIRTDLETGHTFGLLDIDGQFFCHTLEDEDRKLEAGGEKVYGKTCIPRGLYEVVLDESQRFKKRMPRLLDVPGFTGVRIHNGNTVADTDGCILVGTVRAAGGEVRNSRLAFGRLMLQLEHAHSQGDSITIEVK